MDHQHHSTIMKLPATAQKRRTKEIVKSNRTVGRRHDWYCFCSGLHWWHWTFLFQEMCNQWICSTSWAEVLRDVTQFSLHLFICSFVIIISSRYIEKSSQVLRFNNMRPLVSLPESRGACFWCNRRDFWVSLDKMYCDCDIVNVRFWLTVVCEIIILTVCTSAQSEQNMPIVVQNSKCCL